MRVSYGSMENRWILYIYRVLAGIISVPLSELKLAIGKRRT